MEYDSLFVFEELGWNFEPSELGAAFGLEQLKKLPGNYSIRQQNFARYLSAVRSEPELFDAPRQLDGLDTAWLGFPLVLRPEAGIDRAAVQVRMEAVGVDTRMVWTGNVTRQPMMRGVDYRALPGGYPNADRVMAHGLLLPCNHFMSGEDVDFVCSALVDAVSEARSGR
jgi:CDP-6-deoxy-D-xylo-4-hexulose-3-dehydrase